MSAVHTYLIALGGNQRHPRWGAPAQVLAQAVETIADNLGAVRAVSRIISSAPIGPSTRRYSNASLILECEHSPLALLAGLQQIESEFGRVRSGQRWRARTLDLDIVLWSGGIFATPNLSIPHPLFRERDFVLGPASTIAPQWRDPVTGLTLRQLYARLTKPRRGR